MKSIGLKGFAIASLMILPVVSASAAQVVDNLELSPATGSVLVGSTISISEILVSKTTSATQEIDSVIGFDPAVFSISGLAAGSTFSSWNNTLSHSPSAGTYDYDISGGSIGVTGTSVSPTDYTVLSFTLTALTASPGSDVSILLNDGGTVTTRVLNDSVAMTLNPAPSNSFNAAIDSVITVTAPRLLSPRPFCSSRFLWRVSCCFAAARTDNSAAR